MGNLYAKISCIRVTGLMQLGGHEKEKADSRLHIAVWHWRHDAASLFSYLLHLQYFRRYIARASHDAGKRGDRRDGWDGGRHPFGSDRGVPRRYWKFGTAFHRAFAVSLLVAGAGCAEKEKGKRPDCLCSLPAGILSYHAVSVANMRRKPFVLIRIYLSYHAVSVANMRGLKARGSLTVEAALVVPIVLFCILLFLNQGLDLYGELVKTAQRQEMWEEFNPADKFRRLELLGEIAGG